MVIEGAMPRKILGSQDFRHFVQPGSENELLRQFCEREILMGKFLREFRVGTTIAGKLPRAGDDNPTLRPIDAVCVLGLPHDYHLVWLGNEGKKRMTKSRHGRFAKSEWCPSVGDKVALIEVKSGKPNHESVGQLFVYRTLYEQDYPQCAVDQLWIIALHDDPLVRAACEELGISVWTEDRDGTDS